MKTRKSLLALLLVAVLILSLSVPAFAASAKYDTTKAFIDALEGKSYRYNYVGIDNDDDEKITISFRGDYADSIKVNCFFTEDEERVSMRVWNLIDFNESDFSRVLKTCNDLHEQYKFVTFFVDTSDWSITAKIDVPIRPGDGCGDCSLDALLYLVNISDLGYDLLKQYAI